MSMKAIRKHLKKQETKPDDGGFTSIGAFIGFVGGVFVPMYFFGASYAEAFFLGVVCAVVVAIAAIWLPDIFSTKPEPASDDRGDQQGSKQDTPD